MLAEAPYVADLGEACPVSQNIFISPVNITANGRAHPGHAAGPYLRMDVIGRYLKRSDPKTSSRNGSLLRSSPRCCPVGHCF